MKLKLQNIKKLWEVKFHYFLDLKQNDAKDL